MVQIAQEEYLDLLRAKEKISCLESYGVDNWEGYGDAMENYVDPKDKIQMEESAKEIMDMILSELEYEYDPGGPGTGVDFGPSKKALGVIEEILRLGKDGFEIEDVLKKLKD